MRLNGLWKMVERADWYDLPPRGFWFRLLLRMSGKQFSGLTIHGQETRLNRER